MSPRPPRPSKARAYLRLSRVSNLPTVWTNVLAGMVASGMSFDRATLIRTALAMSTMYTGGMFLNDAFDAAFDVVHRPDRPIPSGDVRRSEALGIGFGLVLAGAEVFFQPSTRAFGGRTCCTPAQNWAGVLAVAIVAYNILHKRTRASVLVMGACRGLVYVVAAAAAGAPSMAPVVGPALGLTAYVVALTGVARLVGQRAGMLMPLLIAGISIVDAAVILATNGSVALALVAVLGFALTLALQRVVPGT